MINTIRRTFTVNLTATLCFLAALAFHQVVLAAPPTKEDKAAASSSTSSTQVSTKKVDLNTATKAELESLPGIGSTTADAIIAARPFKSVDDLTRVKGIGDAKLEALRPHVKVSRTHTTTKSAADNGEAKGSAAATSSGRLHQSEEAASTAESPSVGRARSRADASERTGAREPVAKDTADSARSTDRGMPGLSSSTSSAAAPAVVGKIDLNTASKEELEKLPGIGPVRAQAIIDNRPYSKPEDVMKVKGIKEGVYSQIKDRVTVSSRSR